MTGRHSGRLHAARLLLKVCVCVACVHIYQEKRTRQLACASASLRQWSLLFISLCVYISCIGLLCTFGKRAPTLTCHCKRKSTILQPVHFDCLREQHWEEGEKEKEREPECLSLPILSVSLDSSVAAQSDQTSYRFGVFGLNRLQQPQLHRKRRCTVK